MRGSIKVTKVVGAGEDGRSLRALLKAWTGLSAAAVNHWLDAGGIEVQGRIERFGSVRLRAGNTVHFRSAPAAAATSAPPNLGEEDVLFRNEMCLVYNKPPGYPCQRTLDEGRWNLEDALNEWLEKRGAGTPRLHLVHRLDRDTSGALLFARGQENARTLESWFHERRVAKTYLALCHGAARPEEGRWTQRIGKTEVMGGVRRYGIVVRGGLNAITDYRVLASKQGFSFWRLKPLTGRTHQLRVQLAAAGHPIAGDSLYDPDQRRREPLDHHLLHALLLALPPESGAPGEIRAPLPPLFAALLRRLGLQEP